MELYRNEYILKDGERLIIRTAEVSDAKSLIEQVKIVDKETKFLAREPDEFDLTIEQESEFIRNSMDDENSHFLIGEIDGRIVATCSVGPVMNKKRFLHRATMGIAVRKEYWNKGIGKKMVHESIKWCRKKGFEQLELEVATQNERAISMYKSFDFEIYGTKKHAFKYSDGTYADEYFMCLFLENSSSELVGLVEDSK